MFTTSVVFVQSSLIAAILAVGAPAFAQAVPPAADGEAGEADVTVGVTHLSEALPDHPSSIPLRDWLLDDGLIAGSTTKQAGRSIGSIPRIPRMPQPRARTPRSGAYKGAQRVLAGVAMAVMGSVAGTAVGALAGAAGCGGCEDGAFYGMMVGAPVGAAAGATLGVILAR